MSKQKAHPFDRFLEWREHRIALLNERASIATQSPIIGPLSDERSLMAAVKHVLKTVGCAIDPPLVRAMLDEMGFPVSKYKGNPLLSIHPTLKRMVAKGLVRETICDDCKEYEWIDPS